MEATVWGQCGEEERWDPGGQHAACGAVRCRVIGAREGSMWLVLGVHLAGWYLLEPLV